VFLTRVKDALPRGRTLPPADFDRRHRAMLALLWILAGGLVAFALRLGTPPVHALSEGAAVAAFALAAIVGPRTRRWRSISVSVGLMTSAAVLVHVWSGRIEAHFLFFVLVGVLALYEDWVPFGLAVGYVVAEHGVMGVIDPHGVYDHPAAWASPWLWALIHGVFVLGACAAAVTSWRLNERTREHMTFQALHDPLTGLPNRTLFVDRLAIALARARRSGALGAVLFLDLDRFKVVNDSLGHHAGDEVLLAVAARLDEVLRVNDTAARFGGDEFTVLAEDFADEADVLELAERVAGAFAAPMAVAGRELALSASIGVALMGGAETPEDLLRDADAAMYRAKERGRDRIEVFDETLRERVTKRLELENDLRRAISGGELRTHYQPKVRIDTREIVGVEALVRWEHPERGLVPPGDFIPLAEETGLIIDLGAWVLRDACSRAASWDVTVSVNLSRRQLGQEDLLELVAATLAETGLPAERLCLEITESTVMRDPERSLETLRALKALGVALAIDDFGVGYSSLSQLKHLPPVDLLKIDKSFVDNLASGVEDRAIVTAILSLAGAYGMTSVAEGVEDADQVAALEALGCELAQGFLFARPQPPEAVDRLLQSGLAAATGTL
jgi:diguanylate cyclase (GGDEF)-like protein